jgi:uncharacterized membrane protein YebE (DUF533 family)
MNKLVETRQSLGQLTLDELADYMASTGVTSQNSNTAQAEFLRRQTSSIVETAMAARWNSRYMLASVVVLALGSVLTAGAMMYMVYHASQATQSAQVAPSAQVAQSAQITPSAQVAPLLPQPPPAPAPAPRRNGPVRP